MDMTRKSDTIIVGRTAILGLIMAPLDSSNTRNKFGWLLRDNVTEIHGMLGFSPQLLYMLSQITHFAACMIEVLCPSPSS
jgi:hypothetical protein